MQRGAQGKASSLRRLFVSKIDSDASSCPAGQLSSCQLLQLSHVSYRFSERAVILIRLTLSPNLSFIVFEVIRVCLKPNSAFYRVSYRFLEPLVPSHAISNLDICPHWQWSPSVVSKQKQWDTSECINRLYDHIWGTDWRVWSTRS
jgi:hypothetical protein